MIETQRRWDLTLRFEDGTTHGDEWGIWNIPGDSPQDALDNFMNDPGGIDTTRPLIKWDAQVRGQRRIQHQSDLDECMAIWNAGSDHE